MLNRPKVSVIIATYAWPDALKISITSALQQSIQDIEIIVVGDGCVESKRVVDEIGDNRVRWLGLSTNSGGQSAPNNAGIEIANSEFIAYLGHDDLWAPNHLESLLQAQKTSQADFIYSSAILYGPPDTEIRLVSGLPLRSEPRKEQFAPPTTVMHKRSLIQQIGGWKNPREVTLPVDFELQQRAWEAGAKFACTHKVTAFKFPAAWLRDSYKIRDVSRQRNLLYRMKNEKNFIENELLQVIKAAECAELLTMGVVKPLSTGDYYKINGLIKGTLEPTHPTPDLNSTVTKTLEEITIAFEWHGLEQTSSGTTFRWTGPRTESSIDIPIAFHTDVVMDIHILSTITQDILDSLILLVNNMPVSYSKDGLKLTSFISQEIVNAGKENNLRLTFKTQKTIAPMELDPNNADKRRLGIAVASIDIRSAVYTPS